MIVSKYGERKRPKVMFERVNEKGEIVPDMGRTKQADKAACDINNILARFEKTGQLPQMISRDARYGDFSDVATYDQAMMVVAHAQEQFDALDAVVRKRFGNDPAQMLEFCSDPKNKDEMIKLGLALPKAKEKHNGHEQSSEAAPAATATPPKT